MSAKYRLADAAARAAAHTSFQIPSELERSSLKIGALAKLCFVDDRPDEQIGAERMWVEVKSIARELTGIVYVGELLNEPVTIPGLVKGAKVTFEPRHVASIE